MEARDASGVAGIIIKSIDGFAFRVYDENGKFTDYDLNHDDLAVTIDKNSLASLYQSKQKNILDHSPSVLGLKPASL